MKTFAGFAALLIALVVTPLTLAAKRPADLVATHGYVYVNMPKGGPIPVALAIKPIGKNKRIALKLRQDANLQAYGAWVPAGDYSFATWDNLEWGEHDSFTVQPGKITDLGSLVSVMIGGSEFVPLSLRPREVDGRVQDAFAEVQPALASEVIEWHPRRLPKPIKIVAPAGQGLVVDLLMAYDHKVNTPPLSSRLRAATDPQEFLALVRTTMPPLFSDGFAANGNLYFGADLGQVRVRSPQGVWSSLDTGSIWRVTALNSIDGTLFAGAQNLIYKANADHSSFRQIAELPRGEWVSGIDRTDAGWLIATIEPTVTYRGPSVKAVRIYVAKTDDLNGRTLLKEIIVDDKKAMMHYRRTDSAVANGYYFANALGELVRIKLATMEVESLVQPTPAHGLKISLPSATLAAYQVGGMSSKVFVSTDNGNSWVERDAPALLQDAHFTDAGSGHIIRVNRGTFVVTQELLSYDPAGNKWKKIFETPQGCVRVLHDASGAPAFCVTNGSSILARRDDKWVAEFGVE